MDIESLEVLRTRISALVQEAAAIAKEIDVETLTIEYAEVVAIEAPKDESATQKWRAASREIWTAYESLRTVGRALAEASWLQKSLVVSPLQTGEPDQIPT